MAHKLYTELYLFHNLFAVSDIWNASNAGGWSQDETLELLFTTKELWPNPDWEMVSLFSSYTLSMHLGSDMISLVW